MNKALRILLVLSILVISAVPASATTTCIETATKRAQRIATSANNKCTSAQAAVTRADASIARLQGELPSARNDKHKASIQRRIDNAISQRTNRQTNANTKCQAAAVASGNVASAGSICSAFASNPKPNNSSPNNNNPTGNIPTSNPPTNNIPTNNPPTSNTPTTTPGDSGIRGGGTTGGIRGDGGTSGGATR